MTNTTGPKISIVKSRIFFVYNLIWTKNNYANQFDWLQQPTFSVRVKFGSKFLLQLLKYI